MSDQQQKLKRVDPLLRARKAQFDKEAQSLQELRLLKIQAVTELKQCQYDYIGGVDRLNNERQSVDRNKLLALESSVDHAKSIWYRNLKRVQELEAREKAQLANVLVAQKNLKSVEKLQERYHYQLVDHLEKAEQKQMDELSIWKFSQEG